jgi:hypothetical protein
MYAPSTNLQDTLAAIAALATVGAVLCVRYWRTALQVGLVIVIAIAFSGVAAVMYCLTWLMTRIH